ncbi:MAG: hypothetical protein M1819_004122 [Sarea resinae]|nr:MAG: hypothetical protein M1819_004122 [Sarea resinae]
MDMPMSSAASSPTSSMAMAGMSSSSTMSMPMASSTSSTSASMDNTMQTTFFTSHSTPLYSLSWHPQTTGTYAGTCIFLIVLASIFRLLLAAKHVCEQRWLDDAMQRRYIVVADATPEAERVARDPDGKEATLISARGVEESVRVVKRKGRGVTPWRITVDGPRALLVVVIAGVGYLLMIAVMTMNVGYFLSVLGGVFLGELAVGRYVQLEEH